MYQGLHKAINSFYGIVNLNMEMVISSFFSFRSPNLVFHNLDLFQLSCRLMSQKRRIYAISRV